MDASLAAQWRAGEITFHDLLRSHDELNYETLAQSLGVPLSAAMVSLRLSDDGEWPVEDQPRIVSAQASYDAGLCELMTGRHGGYFVLYCFVRKKSKPARGYFHE